MPGVLFDEIVKGVTLRKGEAALERIDLGALRMDLLAAWDGAEVIRQVIPQGMDFGLRPQEGWNALECFHILSGEAQWQTDERVIRLGPGDSLVGAPVQEPCILRAQSEIHALYICSRPSFHEVSDQLAYLRQLAISVEAKDGYTEAHCGRIQDLAMAVGRHLGLSPERQYDLFYSAFLHDLGKVGVPGAILLKPGPLTPQEWAVMREHPTIGARMLENSVVASAAPIIAQHHERLDGSGYPLGLSGEEISLEARIIAVIDSFDAMTTDRVYRPAMSARSAMAELERLAGTHYDPDVVRHFRTVVEGERNLREERIS